jgi:hypothetical protein
LVVGTLKTYHKRFLHRMIDYPWTSREATALNLSLNRAHLIKTFCFCNEYTRAAIEAVSHGRRLLDYSPSTQTQTHTHTHIQERVSPWPQKRKSHLVRQAQQAQEKSRCMCDVKNDSLLFWTCILPSIQVTIIYHIPLLEPKNKSARRPASPFEGITNQTSNPLVSGTPSMQWTFCAISGRLFS